ncbi:beta-N-acetylhexosaminidase [Rhizobium laguerreae]|uniref:beta-N-acetylhexosaminidase n=1 Tax=Rhizobium laguerreae TaxID=1076926 RepID=UPI001C910403|nr:family 20 glycosylhydrolase [Rhizobium laguerreae]MBY3172678.1 beta-N-acetylhexosaminidase [Rhizobium laguerreae]MBY3232849.1 beta-N-acetylhexosaminidase [Rhizobium laguerreae]MBY3390691.1 beta-N-acetylhexosaminidase [Rhizobium laguerreae]MBY3404352.1 beta-N-acetylhexosaminidase [Rhizobium laguerreae]MBY3411345.1 beta-N-acetylhexosaminidase [Rhizobium laguerreae]
MADYHLEASWSPIEGSFGRLTFTLFNLSTEPLSGFSLAYTSETRVADKHVCNGGSLKRQVAHFHEFLPPEGLSVPPGGRWRFTVEGLTRAPKHMTSGVKSAYLTLGDGRHVSVGFGDLMLEGRDGGVAPPLLPQGRAEEPYSLLPWPLALGLKAGELPVVLYPAERTRPDAIKALSLVLALYQRLYPADNVPFSLSTVEGGRAIRFVTESSIAAFAYELRFTAHEIVLSSADAAGRHYGLISLAQLLHGARADRERFKFPNFGTVADQPRYDWRGCHLDVSRQFYPVADVVRLIDILAWNKLNIFHWHLTDDEAWRLEIKAYPALTEIGARRGPDEVLVPQLGDGAQTRAGHYTQEDASRIVAHAASLHIEVVPEIDIPGHSMATLFSLPELVDGQEAPDSYRSVQGYPNNALNPAVEFTYEFLGKVFDEMVTLFPGEYLHIGGDEVAHGSWLASPLCKALMEREKLAGTAELQSYFLKRIKAMLSERGKKLVGWNEVSHGGGVDRDGTLLMAWEKPAVGIELAQEGYDVVMTPGQAYYLDMAQAEAWAEPGASWAGYAPPEYTYAYEAEGELPEALQEKIRGIQACIWTENFLSRAYFNRLVFPRLPAIAEAAWTPSARKDWDRFAAIVRMWPVL